jgi:hypothetical protein
MKILLLYIAFLILPHNTKAQLNKTRIIQLNGNVDIQGNINIFSIEKSNIDTLVNIKELNELIQKNRTAIKIINQLLNKGWVLLTAINVNKDVNDRPASPFIAYYFRKDF